MVVNDERFRAMVYVEIDYNDTFVHLVLILSTLNRKMEGIIDLGGTLSQNLSRYEVLLTTCPPCYWFCPIIAPLAVFMELLESLTRWAKRLT